MQTTIQKWGNSLGVRIPKALTVNAQITEGSEIDISFIDGNIIITPKKKKYSLENLLNKVTEDNVHYETNTGNTVGKEVW